MRSISMLIGVGSVTLATVTTGFAQVSLESATLYEPNLPLATIFSPPPKRPSNPEEGTLSLSDTMSVKKEFHLPTKGRKYEIPRDWEDFERKFAPETHAGKPHLDILEQGLYQFNQTLYSIKLFERHVNSLFNVEYSLRELGNYDRRTKANAPDDFFDHAKVKTDFEWDAPIGIYVGIRFELKCDSIFQFWK